jgi:hypothetical protein
VFGDAFFDDAFLDDDIYVGFLLLQSSWPEYGTKNNIYPSSREHHASILATPSQHG